MLPYKVTESSSGFRLPLARVESSEDALRIRAGRGLRKVLRMEERGMRRKDGRRRMEDGGRKIEVGGWRIHVRT
jgi:hypothetical protein